MTNENIELSRRKILAGMGAVGAAGVGAGLGTSALFSDEETFENNALVAGELDLKVSWDEHYFDGSAGTEYGEYVSGDGDLDGAVGFPEPAPLFAVDEEAVGDFMAATRQERFPEGGLGAEEDPCEALADVPQDLPAPVIELDDVKPGDFGEVTFDFSLCDNPGYLWMTGGLVSGNENGVIEPESDAPGENDTPDSSSLWPLAALAAVPALGGDDGDDGDGNGGVEAAETQAETETDSADGSDRRSALRKGAAAAGAGSAGLSAASGLASADSGKGSPPDPNPNSDVSIDNGTLSVSVDEQGSSGFAFGGDNSTVYFEEYGFRDGSSGTHVEATDGSVSVTDAFPSSVSPGTTASATLDYPVPTSGGTDVDLEVKRNVTLDTSAPVLRVEYEVTNPSGSGATFSDLRLSQYVDYDIGGINNNTGRYFLDSTTGCEFIWQETEGDDIFAGFTAEEQSVAHGLTTWSSGTNTFDDADISSILNGDDVHLDGGGTTDVELTFEWSLGELAPGDTATLRTSFVYNDQGQAEFENQICQESPGTPTPTPTPSEGDSELADKVQVRAWYDGGGGDGPDGDIGDNINQDDEQVFLEGTLREALNALSSGSGVPLDGDESTNTDFDETGDPPDASSRDCYTAANDVHYIGFEWWVPRSVGNEIQSDSVTFDLGFYTEQCRNNDGIANNP